jgi:hypothetical protein
MDVRKASKAARHFDSDAPVLRNSVSDFANAPASTKNRTSNMPSCPVNRTAFRTSSKLRLGLGKAKVMKVSPLSRKMQSRPVPTGIRRGGRRRDG